MNEEQLAESKPKQTEVILLSRQKHLEEFVATKLFSLADDT